MRIIGKIIGYLIWIGASIWIFIFWLKALSKWLGFLGVILAFILSPGLVIFPLIYWIVEGTFPVFYFMLWIISMLGVIIISISSKKKDKFYYY